MNVTKAINGGAGVLYIYGNYGGDIMNFDMAKDMAAMEDITVEQVVGAEDVASAPKGQEGKRRGVAGIFFLYKCAGAMADTLAPLAEVKRVAEKAGANVRTMGVALSPNIVPGGRQAPVHPRGERDGDRDGHPRGAGDPPRPAEERWTPSWRK